MTELSSKLNIELQDIKQLNPKEIGIRKKIDIFSANDKNSSTYLILNISQKSRVLQKDVEKFEEIYEKIKEFININFDNKIVMIDAPLCSKAKAKFEENNWSIIV